MTPSRFASRRGSRVEANSSLFWPVRFLPWVSWLEFVGFVGFTYGGEISPGINLVVSTVLEAGETRQTLRTKSNPEKQHDKRGSGLSRRSNRNAVPNDVKGRTNIDHAQQMRAVGSH